MSYIYMLFLRLSKSLMAIVVLLSATVNFAFSQSCGWDTVHTDKNAAFMSIYFVNATTGYSVNVKTRGGIFYPYVIKSTDAGINWTEQYTPLRDTANVFLPDVYFIDANTGIITASNIYTFNYGRILRTTNGGANWEIKYLPPPDKYVANIFFINALTGYVSGHSRIYVTNDAGNTWAAQIPGISLPLAGIYFTSPYTGYVVGNAGTIKKTTDAGGTWITKTPNTGQHLWGLWFINANTGFICGGYNTPTSNNIILKTTDAGENWIQVPYTYSDGWLYTVRFISATTGFIIGWKSQVLKTTNGGVTWVNQSLPFDNFAGRSCYFTNANTGYLTGHFDLTAPGDSTSYIFKTTNGGITFVNHVSNETPSEFILFQNYPNPFNPSTTIRFNIPLWRGQGGGIVTLKVYDILSKEVATLVNEKLQPGTYEVTFDGSSIPSGVYFYKLSSGNFSETKKMLLIK